jgi:hypothetical protein
MGEYISLHDCIESAKYVIADIEQTASEDTIGSNT